MEQKPESGENKKHLFIFLIDKTQSCVFDNTSNICDIFKKFYPEDRNILIPKLIKQTTKTGNNRLWNLENLVTCLELCEQLYIYKKDGFLTTIITHGIGIEYISVVSQLLSKNMQPDVTLFSQKAEPGLNTFNVHFLDTKIYLKSFLKYLNFDLSQTPIIDHVYTFNAVDNDACVHVEPEAIGQHIHFISTDFYWKKILGATPKTTKTFKQIASVSSGVKPPSEKNKEEIESLLSFFLQEDSDIKPENKLFMQTAATSLFLNLPVIGKKVTSKAKTFDVIMSPAKFKQTPEIIIKDQELSLNKGINNKKRSFIIITDPLSSFYEYHLKFALSLQVTHLADTTCIYTVEHEKNKQLNANFWNLLNLKKAKDICKSILEDKKNDIATTIIADGAGIWIAALASQLLSADKEVDIAFSQVNSMNETSYLEEIQLFKSQFLEIKKEVRNLKKLHNFKKNKFFIDTIYSYNTPDCVFAFYIDPIAVGHHIYLFSTNKTWKSLIGSKTGTALTLNTVFCNVRPPQKKHTTTTSTSCFNFCNFSPEEEDDNFTCIPHSNEYISMVYAFGAKITKFESFFPLKKNIVALWPIEDNEPIKIIDN